MPASNFCPYVTSLLSISISISIIQSLSFFSLSVPPLPIILEIQFFSSPAHIISLLFLPLPLFLFSLSLFFRQYHHVGIAGYTSFMTITGAPEEFPARLRILTIMNAYRRSSKLFSSDDPVRSSDSVFWFIEGSEDSLDNTPSDGAREDIIDVFDEEVEGENSTIDLQSKKNFWENQHNLLQTTLYRTTALETGIRNATREALKKIDEARENYCNCGKASVGNDCRFCQMRKIANRLCEASYNCGVCRSRWTSSSDVPSGKHTYLDIIDSSSTKKGEVRVIIELNFRSEFEIAKASQDYNELISRLPEVFVGKVERLHALVKILCSAAKKCMKDKKMHMGPWRRYKYMQAKWFTLSERLETDA